MTVPMTAAEKYSLDFFSLPAAWPRMVLKRTLPPMPVSRPETVNDVPDRGDYGQRRRLVRRPLILPHHGGVYYAVDGRDQDAAKGGEVFEVDRSDLIRQEIAREDCLAGSICRVQKGLDKYRRLSLLPYPAHHFQRMICPPSKQSV